jgi:hypothetical protein
MDHNHPPFRLGLEFTLRALALATEGVAMFARTQWIESAERYERLFRDRQPALLAPFVERVPIVKGHWNPKKSTATSYAWFVWRIGERRADARLLDPARLPRPAHPAG